MNGRAHTAVGMAAITTTMSLGWINPGINVLLSCVVGSLAPDIDKDNTTINNALNLSKPVYFLIGLIILYFNRTLHGALMSIPFFVLAFIKHRGFTHKWYGFVPILGLLYFLLPKILYFGFVIGYMSHLILDQFNPNIKLVKPFKSINIEKGVVFISMIVNAYNIYIIVSNFI